MRRFPRTAFAAAVLLLVPAFGAAQPATLRQALKDKGVPLDTRALPNLDRPISGGAELDDARQLVAAYYLGDADVEAPLYLDRFDRKTGKWSSGKLASVAAHAEAVDAPCLGAVLEIRSFGDDLLLDTHINPSAGCTLIVSSDLHLKGSLYGWFLAALGPHRIVYHRSEIHFAPVHETEIALYDLESGRDLALFPQAPAQTVRAGLEKTLREFYSQHRDWCREHDHPCDTQQIDSELVSEMAGNPQQDALAFVISYETQVFQPGEIQAPGGPKAVLYVYRHVSDNARREFREILLPEENAPHREAELGVYLTPERLEQIFSGKANRP